jgi:hypothetical protein
MFAVRFHGGRQSVVTAAVSLASNGVPRGPLRAGLRELQLGADRHPGDVALPDRRQADPRASGFEPGTRPPGRPLPGIPILSGLDASTALFEARGCMSCGNSFDCYNRYGACLGSAVIKTGSSG